MLCTHETVASLLASRLATSQRKPADVAYAAGLAGPADLDAIARGQADLPLDKAMAVASALGLEPVSFMALCLREYQPALWPAIEPLLDLSVTADERRLLIGLRKFVGVPYIACMDDESKWQLNELCMSMQTRHSQVRTLQ